MCKHSCAAAAAGPRRRCSGTGSDGGQLRNDALGQERRVGPRLLRSLVRLSHPPTHTQRGREREAEGQRASAIGHACVPDWNWLCRCGHCKHLAPIWDQAADKVAQEGLDVHFAKMDCTVRAHYSICERCAVYACLYVVMCVLARCCAAHHFSRLRAVWQQAHQTKTQRKQVLGIGLSVAAGDLADGKASQKISGRSRCRRHRSLRQAPCGAPHPPSAHRPHPPSVEIASGMQWQGLKGITWALALECPPGMGLSAYEAHGFGPCASTHTCTHTHTNTPHRRQRIRSSRQLRTSRTLSTACR